MSLHVVSKWFLFFFIYSLVGWVWETSFVYFRTGHFENRGLLWGPYLPIYGIGAVFILFSTAHVKNNLWLIFFLGLISATIVEYVGGSLLQMVFQTRYWDYRGAFLNIHGHICLICSLAWGLFSIGLVRWLHPRTAHFLQQIPNTLLTTLSISSLFVIIADFLLVLQKHWNLFSPK